MGDLKYRRERTQRLLHSLFCALDHLEEASAIMREWRDRMSVYGLTIKPSLDRTGDINEARGYIHDALYSLQQAGYDVTRPGSHIKNEQTPPK